MNNNPIHRPVTARNGAVSIGLIILGAVLVAKVLPHKKSDVSVKEVTVGATPTPPSAPKVKPEDLPVITVAKLYQAHSINSLAAEKATKSREMIVVGKVGDIGKDALGVAYLVLTDGKGNETQMIFEKADENALLHIGKGQVAAVRGIVGGKGFLGTILCRKCSLVSIE